MDWDNDPDVRQRTFRYFGRGLRLVWKLAESQRKPLRLALALLVVSRLLDFVLPLVFKQLFDLLPEAKATGSTREGDTFLAVAAVIGFAGMALHHFKKERLFLRSLIFLEGTWPVQAQRKLLGLHLGFHERENTGRKMSKVSKGTDKLTAIMCDLWWGFIPSLLFLVINMVMVTVTDWRLACALFLPLIPAVLFFMRGHKRHTPAWELCEKKREEASGMFCQSIVNVRTVQAYVQETRELSRVTAVRTPVITLDTDACMDIQRNGFIVNACSYVGLLSAVWIGFHGIVAGRMTEGTVSFVFVTGFTMMHVLWETLHTYTRILKNLVAGERMYELMLKEEEVVNRPTAAFPEAADSAFRFECVSFRYPGRNEAVLDNISLELPHGEMVALVGRSGAGKTTLVHLLARMRDVTDGRITFGGIDIRELDRDRLRGLFAFVHQHVEIFDGTIADNIAYGTPDASVDDVCRAIRAASFDDVLNDVDAFPNGIDTIVGERGVTLSGGQQQRVGIARAYLKLLHGARVLIFDEATSNLDPITERTVQTFLAQLRAQHDITIVVIAHRLATTINADRILVTEDGDIKEEGTHESLIAKGGLYAKLVQMQDLGERSNVPEAV